jgi:alpha-glucosidase (family GH31 glycosyl hydrolase)
MEAKMIFTVNSRTHGNNQLNNLMKNHEVNFVPLLDAGVAIGDQTATKLGTELDVFLKAPNKNNVYYVGEVWPGQVHFVDFLHPNAINFWKMQMQRLYEQVQFSGIWIDMNEPSNFRGNEPTVEPFRIQKNDGINQMTINVDIPHHSNSQTPLTHREVHTYYGHLSTVPIHEFLLEKGKRPFIISRSNSVGSGRFAGHWTGDNVADWEFLRLSINGNFLFQIFGIQMVGADICGFNRDTT